MTKRTALETARQAVRKETFGTEAWETKMQIVRALVDAENAAAPRFEHTSLDGDIWAPR